MRAFCPCLLALSAVLASSHLSEAAVIDFEQFSDGDILAGQVPGLTFSNTTVLSAGISLNEFEFPPHSGMNVVSDNGGPISISFSNPVSIFSGYFTYAAALTLQAFNSSGMQVGSVQSTFNSNDALFGDAGSSPNELLRLASATGIFSVTITGDPAGGSFVLDDITFQTADVPETQTGLLFLFGLGGLATVRKKHPR